MGIVNQNSFRTSLTYADRDINMRSVIGCLLLILHYCSHTSTGFPQYSSNYDYDYEDEEYSISEEDLDLKDYNTHLVMKSKTVEVDAGTTIRLNCEINNLNPELNQYVMWKRENSANTFISTGDTIVNEEYSSRAKVSFTESGSELTITAAGPEDSGRYMCKLALPDNTQSVTHIVIVRGEPKESDDTPAHLTVSEGDDMKLTCTISDKSKASASWSKQGGLLPNGKEEEETSVLSVDNVKMKDSGVYMCTASDHNGNRLIHKMVKVKVQELSQDPNSACGKLASIFVLLVTLVVVHL